VPFVFFSGMSQQELRRWPSAPVVQKPAGPAAIIGALAMQRTYAARAQQCYRIGFLANDPTIPSQPAYRTFLDASAGRRPHPDRARRGRRRQPGWVCS
jgi:hypothetical protein